MKTDNFDERLPCVAQPLIAEARIAIPTRTFDFFKTLVDEVQL